MADTKLTATVECTTISVCHDGEHDACEPTDELPLLGSTHYSHVQYTTVSSVEVQNRSRLLLQAARDGLPQRLRAQLSAGADIDYRDEEGWTPLQYAVSSVACLRILVEAGSDINAVTDAPDCRHPLELAAADGHATTLQVLFTCPCIQLDKSEGRFGYTALHQAARNGHDDCVRVLIDAGAKVNTADFGRIRLFTMPHSVATPISSRLWWKQVAKSMR